MRTKETLVIEGHTDGVKPELAASVMTAASYNRLTLSVLARRTAIGAERALGPLIREHSGGYWIASSPRGPPRQAMLMRNVASSRASASWGVSASSVNNWPGASSTV